MAWYEKYSWDYTPDENPVSNGGVWSIASGDALRTVSGKLYPQTSQEYDCAYITPSPSLTSNNYAYTMANSAGDYLGVGSRFVTSGVGTGYMVFGHIYGYDTMKLYRVDDESVTWTLLHTGGSIAIQSLWIKTECEGTTIKTYTSGNESTWDNRNSATDSTYSSGSSGYVWLNNNNTPAQGAYKMGDDSAPSTGHPTIMRFGGVPYMTPGRRKW